MISIDVALLETVTGGAVAGCTVTNNSDRKLVRTGAGLLSVEGGQSTTVPPGKFAVTDERGSTALGVCLPGRNFDISSPARGPVQEVPPPQTPF